MKNKSGISRIKLIFIIVGIIVIFLIISEIIDQKKAKENKEYLLAQEKARYEASYNIGDTITTNDYGNYEMTVINVEERTKVGIPKYYKTVDDFSEILICATVKIKSLNNEPVRLYNYRPDFSLYIKLEDNEGHEYHNDTTYTTYYQYEFDYGKMELILNPGETVTDVVVFRLDKSQYERNLYLNLGNTALVKIK